MSEQATIDIAIEQPVLGREGARAFDSYLAHPRSGKGPGLVIFTEMWGVAPSKTEMAEEYAAAGWCALVPNMFWRSEFAGRVPFENADLALSLIHI